MSDKVAGTIRYGEGCGQFGELTRPAGNPRGIVVVIHGGFWKAAYDLALGRPLAADLARHGWIAWNLEYRRVGNGGGWPATATDIAAGIDRLASIPDLATSTVVTLGHSAGGQLALWAGARIDPAVPITAAISQAGVLDLDAAVRDRLGSDAVRAFVAADDRAEADPIRQVPLDIPVWCVHGNRDDTVPIGQSRAYVAAATAAGASATLIELDADHYDLIDPASQAWSKTLGLLDEL